MTKMKISYYVVSMWDFDGLTVEELTQNLKLNIEAEKSKFGDASNTVVTVCDIDDSLINFRIKKILLFGIKFKRNRIEKFLKH